MHTLERKHDPADRSSVQHILHGLLLCTSERSLLFLVTSSFIFVPVCRSIRQVLVYAGASLFRRLLYDSTVHCLNIPGPYMDR